MLYEIAITPDVFDAAHVSRDRAHGVEVRELLRQMLVNGLIADLDKGGWRTTVDADLGDWGDPAAKDKVIALINQLGRHHRLVRHPKRLEGRPTSQDHWLRLIQDSHRRVGFDWIVTGEDFCPDDWRPIGNVMSLTGILNAEAFEGRRRSRTVRLCEQDYEPALVPLLRHAKSLDIVDPFLKPSHGGTERLNRFVELCANTMGNRGHALLPGVIRLHMSPNKIRPTRSTDALLCEWRERLERFRQRSRTLHTFHVVAWGMSPDDEELHDRFLLTDQYGVVSGNSFTSGKTETTRKTGWTLLDDGEWESHRTMYSNAILPHAKLGELRVG